ncbi:hypothetical protein [Methanothermococcus sp.]|uniref:hypothetical protein n=1 Tax=Methanothermococcus sp. TaxID=2614238 RepID=UPI0025DB1F42|nr:hypothetical protein [Methanothermococcus sp.]
MRRYYPIKLIFLKRFYIMIFLLIFSISVSQIYADEWNPPESYTFDISNGHSYRITYNVINTSNSNTISSGSYGIINNNINTYVDLGGSSCNIKLSNSQNKNQLIVNLTSKIGMDINFSLIDLTENKTVTNIIYPSSSGAGNSTVTTTAKAPIPLGAVILTLVATPLIILRRMK